MNSLLSFLSHLNSQHLNIHFIMKLENNGSRQSLDVLVTLRPGRSLPHLLYRKSRYTNKYLHVLSRHHPVQKPSVISSLINRSLLLNKKDSIIFNLKLTTSPKFSQPMAMIRNRILDTIRRLSSPKPKETVNFAKQNYSSINLYLHYVKGITYKISRLLRKPNVKTIFVKIFLLTIP